MPELIVILIIALVVLGPARLPEIARTLGKSYAGLMRAMRSAQSDFKDISDDFDKTAEVVRRPGVALTKAIEESFPEEPEHKPPAKPPEEPEKNNSTSA